MLPVWWLISKRILYNTTIEDIDEEKNLYHRAIPDIHTTSSVTTRKMMSEQVKPDDFKLPHHKLKSNIRAKLEALVKEYATQFTQDETSIGTTPLTQMTIDTRNSEPVSQKTYPIAMKHYLWVKDEIEELLTANVIPGS